MRHGPKLRSRTFYRLALLVAHVRRDLNRITQHKRIAARVVYRALHCRLVLDHVDRKACAFCEGAELVVELVKEGEGITGLRSAPHLSNQALQRWRSRACAEWVCTR
jgi:hypothetical protein